MPPSLTAPDVERFIRDGFIRLEAAFPRPLADECRGLLWASLGLDPNTGGWYPRPNVGTFPIRFPSTEDPGDAGWHIDGSYKVRDQLDVNLRSRERALLMLFLSSPTWARTMRRPARAATGILPRRDRGVPGSRAPLTTGSFTRIVALRTDPPALLDYKQVRGDGCISG